MQFLWRWRRSDGSTDALGPLNCAGLVSFRTWSAKFARRRSSHGQQAGDARGRPSPCRRPADCSVRDGSEQSCGMEISALLALLVETEMAVRHHRTPAHSNVSKPTASLLPLAHRHPLPNSVAVSARAPYSHEEITVCVPTCAWRRMTLRIPMHEFLPLQVAQHPLPCFRHTSTAAASAFSRMARPRAAPLLQHAGKCALRPVPRTSFPAVRHRPVGAAFRRSGNDPRQDEQRKPRPAHARDDFHCLLPSRRGRAVPL